MPENTYFRQSGAQLTLTTILFVWSRLNPDISYRQGMHELLAPILWVVERDAIFLGSSSKALGEDATVRAVFDAESIEADAFALFSQVMRSAKAFYEPSTEKGGENPIVQRSRRIFEEMLPQVDPELAAQLQKADLVPQVFLMRWIRLLFGREFTFDDVLKIWDVIFAEDATLEIVDYVCLAMILRIRWELLDSDYNSALTLLLRYPEPSKDHPPQSLVLDALYLRDHLDTDGSGYLILKYTGRPPIPLNRPETPPALQRNITAFSGVPTLPASLSPTRPGSGRRQPTNLEAVLQSTARTLYARGGQAVRGAVEEVHKRAQEIQKTQTPTLPPRGGNRGPAALERRLSALERRNQQLAKLLEGAVGQLWEYQKVVAERKDGGEEKEASGMEQVEKLSVAIAKVQFVQVYLEDMSLPLPADQGDGDVGGGGEKEEGWTRVERGEAVPSATTVVAEKPSLPPRHDTAGVHEALADPASFDFDSEQATPNNEPVAVPEITVQGPKVDDDAMSAAAAPYSQMDESENPPPPPLRPTAQTPPPKPHHRPALAESPYSFMLGEQPTSAAPSTRKPAAAAASPFSSPETDRRKGKGGLFGDGGGDAKVEDDGTGDGVTIVHAAPRRDKRGTGGRERIRRKVVAVGEKVEGGGEDAFGGRRGSGGT